MLSLDVLKEQLYDLLPAPEPPVQDWAQVLGHTAVHLLLNVARKYKNVIVDAVLSASDAQQQQAIEKLGPVVEVHCQVSAKEAQRRFSIRTQQGRHAVHAWLPELSLEQWQQNAAPITDNALIVNTTNPLHQEEVTKLAAHLILVRR